MLIYTQPGNCPACGGVLRMLPKHDGGTVDPVELFICDTCNNINDNSITTTVNTQSDCTVVHPPLTDDSWMFEEYPDKYSMWELCVESFNKMKRRAALWDDLKRILKNGTWSDQGTIDAVLTNMDYMEDESTHKTGKDADAAVD